MCRPFVNFYLQDVPPLFYTPYQKKKKYSGTSPLALMANGHLTIVATYFWSYPFSPGIYYSKSPYWLPYISLSTNWKNLLRHQDNSSLVIISPILMTFMCYNALIWWGEIWCWSLLGLKRLMIRLLVAVIRVPAHFFSSWWVSKRNIDSVNSLWNINIKILFSCCWNVGYYKQSLFLLRDSRRKLTSKHWSVTYMAASVVSQLDKCITF